MTHNFFTTTRHRAPLLALVGVWAAASASAATVRADPSYQATGRFGMPNPRPSSDSNRNLDGWNRDRAEQGSSNNGRDEGRDASRARPPVPANRFESRDSRPPFIPAQGRLDSGGFRRPVSPVPVQDNRWREESRDSRFRNNDGENRFRNDGNGGRFSNNGRDNRFGNDDRDNRGNWQGKVEVDLGYVTGNRPQRYCPPPVQYCPPPVRYCPPPVQYCPPVRYCPPPVQYCPPPVQYCPPPVQYCPPPARYCPPPVQYCPPLARYCPPPVRYCPPPVHYYPCHNRYYEDTGYYGPYHYDGDGRHDDCYQGDGYGEDALTGVVMERLAGSEFFLRHGIDRIHVVMNRRLPGSFSCGDSVFLRGSFSGDTFYAFDVDITHNE